MSSPKILVVEDEQLIADDLKETLEYLGYEVPVPIASGEAAVTQAALLQPNLILMDIHLNGVLDGIEASKKIQAQSSIPIIFLTANADRSTLERVKAIQPFGYLLKPYDEKVLGTAIEIALSRHQVETAARKALLTAEARQAAAESRNQQKSEYLSMTAHEFRNPLIAIQLAAEMLQDRGENLSKKKQQKHLQRIHTATTNLNDILDKMLVLGQVEIGKRFCEPAPLDLIRFCREQIAVSQSAVGKQYKLTFTTPVESCLVLGDVTLLSQMLNNLLSNAIKYSLEGGQIETVLTLDSERINLQVRDEGIGIPLEAQTQVFQPFYRAHNASGIAGTGLGLAIVKQCVDLHGGQIWVESTLGQGTTVFISLPR